MILEVPFFMGDPMPFGNQVHATDRLAPDLPGGTPQQRMSVLYRALATRVESAVDLPLVVAGDCVSAIGVLAGLQHRGIDPTLVFFDAHGDFHTWETTPSQFIGGMPLAMISGRGEQTIVDGAGLTPLDDGRIVLVDGRDLDPGEPIDQSEIRILDVAEVHRTTVIEGPIHVHIDVDVVDPGEMPAVNFPAPHGPSLEEVGAALEQLASTGRVVAVSFSSWNPALADAERAADATRRLIEVFDVR